MGDVPDRRGRLYTPAPARLLGNKYELVEPVGRGGMASVWLGLTHGEAGFSRKVAIKRVLRHLTKDEKFEQMFVEEAQVVAEMHHPNITQVHDFGRDHEGGYFIVMEWVEGLNLADWVRGFASGGEATPWPLVSAICIEVLRALSAAHSRMDATGRPVPVIHRDVTPANILVGINGNVKLTDFGLSRAIDRPRTTDPGTVKGKVAYIAPEVLEHKQADPRSDLFSVGVVLWEALAARRLFGGQGTDIDIAMRVLEGRVPNIREIRPELPVELEAIMLKALARTPRERFQRATLMIEALAGLLRQGDEPTDGPALGRSVRRARRFLERIEAAKPGTD